MTSPANAVDRDPLRARSDFDQYLRELLAECRRHPLVTGLVLMGSTADRSRVDEWSDHDFAVVCTPGAQERLRGGLAWLPRSATLVASAREHHDGFKALYRDGTVVEFAVVELGELATFHANDFEVAYDCGGVADVMRAVSARPVPGDPADPQRDVGVFLASILIGVGRARRGETLSASGSIRGLCLDHLLVLLRHFVPTMLTSGCDSLDARRRFELAYPQLGSALIEALDAPIERCAELLVDIAHEQLARRWDGYPSDAEDAVRRRLGWGRALDTVTARG